MNKKEPLEKPRESKEFAFGKLRKKGAGHVEFIIAIVLFITVVGGGLILLNPAKSSRTVESSLSYTFNEIEKYAGSKIEVYNVKVNEGATGEIISVGITPSITGANARVEKADGTALLKNNYGTTCFKKADVSVDGKYFAIIKFNEEFDSGTAICPGINGGYELASASKRTVISEKEIINLKGAYDGGYETLRMQFNLPGNDFTFSLVFPDESPITPTSANIPTGLDVFTDSKRIEVLRADGSLTFAELIVTVW